MQTTDLCRLLFALVLLAVTSRCTTFGRESALQPASHHADVKTHAKVAVAHKIEIHSKHKPPVEYREDPEHDECPDIMTHPLEYPSIPHFASTINKPNMTSAMCTLITQCSVDRFDNLHQQALAWNGPISAAIYIFTTGDAEIATQLAEVSKLVNNLNNDDRFQGSLTVSLLFGHENATARWKCDNPEAIGAPLYPINALRNLATAAASTIVGVQLQPPPLMFLVDADFIPSPGLLQWASRDKVVEKCNNGELIVVPAFEAKALNHSTLPSLQFMLDGHKDGSVFQFHKYRFPPGHTPTNYKWWAQHSIPLIGNDTAVHRVHTYPVAYKDDYEPYVILSSKRFVAYDERLRGYGQNKVVQLKWLKSLGATFHAVPGHFVVAASHERPKIATKVMKMNSVTRVSMMRAFNSAVKEMAMKKLPLVSRNHAALLAAAGLGYSFERAIS